MIDALVKALDHGRVLLRRHVRDLQRSPHRINVGPCELGNFLEHLAAVVGEAGPRVGFLARRHFVRPPVQGVDGQGFHPRRDHYRLGHVLRLAVKGDDYARILRSGSEAQVGVCLHFLLGNSPADGVAGHQQRLGLGVGEPVLEQPQAHVRSLGKACQDDGPALVTLLQVIIKGRRHVLIGQGQIGLPLLLRHGVDRQPHLPVIGRIEAARFLVDPLFHVDGSQEVLLGGLVVHVHIAAPFLAQIYRRAHEEHVRFPRLSLRPAGPVFQQAVVGRSLFPALGLGALLRIALDCALGPWRQRQRQE